MLCGVLISKDSLGTTFLLRDGVFLNVACAQIFFKKQGVFGIEIAQLQVPAALPIGATLDFSFWIKNTGQQAQQIRLEYGIDYLTGTGKISRKVFKIKELVLETGASELLQRRQRFTDFTTRKHYPGEHWLRIFVNGQEMAVRGFSLTQSPLFQ